MTCGRAGASGNLATEDLLTLLHSLHIETGIDLAALIETNLWFETHFSTPFPGRRRQRYPSTPPDRNRNLKRAEHFDVLPERQARVEFRLIRACRQPNGKISTFRVRHIGRA